MAISKDHYVSIKNGKFDTTTKADLDHLFSTLAADPKRDHIVIHFHGGLVTQKSALAAAEQTLLNHYRSADAYPVFFFWQTGLRDIVTGNLSEIFSEKIFERLLMRVAQFAVAKLGQTVGARGGRLELPDEFEIQDELSEPAVGDEPYEHVRSGQMPADAELSDVEEAQFREVLDRDPILKREAVAIANGMRTPEEIAADAEARGGVLRVSRHTLMSPDVLEEVRDEAPSEGERGILTTGRIVKGAVSILARVIKRMSSQRDHGLYPTIVEEILHEFYVGSVGELGWRLMKKDSADAFQPDPDQFGGTAFLQGLKAHWEAGHRPRIILVGHSAGSVFICNLLTHADAILPPEIKFDLVFLAPVCTFQQFSDMLDVAENRLGEMRLFTMSDDFEVQDHMVLGYPRSILYFVSGVLEDERDQPIMGMHRFYSPDPPFDPGAFPQVARVRKLFSSAPGRLVWSVEDSGSGRASSATAHSDFDDVDVTTMGSVRHIISQGF